MLRGRLAAAATLVLLVGACAATIPGVPAHGPPEAAQPNPETPATGTTLVGSSDFRGDVAALGVTVRAAETVTGDGATIAVCTTLGRDTDTLAGEMPDLSSFGAFLYGEAMATLRVAVAECVQGVLAGDAPLMEAASAHLDAGVTDLRAVPGLDLSSFG